MEAGGQLATLFRQGKLHIKIREPLLEKEELGFGEDDDDDKLCFNAVKFPSGETYSLPPGISVATPMGAVLDDPDFPERVNTILAKWAVRENAGEIESIREFVAASTIAHYLLLPEQVDKFVRGNLERCVALLNKPEEGEEVSPPPLKRLRLQRQQACQNIQVDEEESEEEEDSEEESDEEYEEESDEEEDSDYESDEDDKIKKTQVEGQLVAVTDKDSFPSFIASLVSKGTTNKQKWKTLGFHFCDVFEKEYNGFITELWRYKRSAEGGYGGGEKDPNAFYLDPELQGIAKKKIKNFYKMESSRDSVNCPIEFEGEEGKKFLRCHLGIVEDGDRLKRKSGGHRPILYECTYADVSNAMCTFMGPIETWAKRAVGHFHGKQHPCRFDFLASWDHQPRKNFLKKIVVHKGEAPMFKDVPGAPLTKTKLIKSSGLDDTGFFTHSNATIEQVFNLLPGFSQETDNVFICETCKYNNDMFSFEHNKTSRLERFQADVLKTSSASLFDIDSSNCSKPLILPWRESYFSGLQVLIARGETEYIRPGALLREIRERFKISGGQLRATISHTDYWETYDKKVKNKYLQYVSFDEEGDRSLKIEVHSDLARLVENTQDREAMDLAIPEPLLEIASYNILKHKAKHSKGPAAFSRWVKMTPPDLKVKSLYEEPGFPELEPFSLQVKCKGEGGGFVKTEITSYTQMLDYLRKKGDKVTADVKNIQNFLK